MSKKEKKENEYKYFWLIVLLSILLVTSLWLYNYNYGYGLTFEQRGIFGDMFGAVNAVFSGLAFAGIIISLYLQRIDLKNQFEEFRTDQNIKDKKFEDYITEEFKNDQSKD